MAKGQRVLERSLMEAYEKFERQTLATQPKRVYSRVAFEISALEREIEALANDKGNLPRDAQSRLNGQLDVLEAKLYRAYSAQLREELKTSADAASVSFAQSLIAAVGPAIVAESVAASVASSASLLLSTGVLPALYIALISGASLADFAALVADYVMGRKVGEGRTTRERLRIFAREVTRAVREAIAQGGNVGNILRRIRNVILETDWRIARLVETESMTAYRTSVARLSEDSEFVVAVKIIDFAHGHEATHPRHKCYEYANADEHGLGRGVYPPTTVKIRNPHPQCRSILVPVLAERG